MAGRPRREPVNLLERARSDLRPGGCHRDQPRFAACVAHLRRTVAQGRADLHVAGQGHRGERGCARSCRRPRTPAFFHKIDGRDTGLVDLTLSQIGIPPWDILTPGRAGTQNNDSTSLAATAPSYWGRWQPIETHEIHRGAAGSAQTGALVMAETRSKPEESIDIRLLERQDLPSEAFPGGRNQGFRRVFSPPEVHAALWKHGSLDTSVEICGVLVGSWHIATRRARSSKSLN